MINEKRMIQNFTRLCRIDSLSGKEREIALFLKKELEKLGGKAVFDKAGKKTGSDTGNLIAKFAGNPNRRPFLLSAHMDTVGPGKGVKPVLKPGKITSSEDTVLGADCKSGIAVILETISVLRETGTPHPPLEVVFSVCEEIGLLGARFLDYSLLKAKRGLVFDSEKPIREVAAKGPAADRIEIEVHGRAAHAGVCPEKGVSAIAIAADALSKMKLGRIDFETTSNIGIIEGGEATNVITPKVKMVGEVRSHKTAKLRRQIKHIEDCLKASVKKRRNGKFASFSFRKTMSFSNLHIGDENPTLNSLRRAMKESGLAMKTAATGGGTDANIFYGHGIKTPILATGMRDVHTTKEYLILSEFFKCARITVKTVSAS